MNYRTLGRTGLQVSEIGYGAWGIGKGMWIGAEDDESIKALNKAVDLGLNFIDTALVYGDGHSEKLVGQVIRARSERIYVASKVPPKKLSMAGSTRSTGPGSFSGRSCHRVHGRKFKKSRIGRCSVAS